MHDSNIDGIEQYAWEVEFRRRLLALSITSDWFAKYGNDIIKPEFFEQDVEIAFCQFVIDFYEDWHRPPDEDEAKAEFVDDEEMNILITEVFECLELDLDYAERQAIKWAKSQAMRVAMIDSVELLESGDVDKVADNAVKASKIGLSMHDMGLDLVDMHKWTNIEEDDRIPTGMALVDRNIGGGIGRAEMGFVLAGTNVGKTKMLVNIGVGAMSMLGKARVLHVSLEERDYLVARRYAARISHQWLTLETDLGEYADQFVKHYKNKVFGELRIKYWPSGTLSIQTLHTYLDQLLYTGFHPDLILIDYPAIMKHTKVGDYRHNLSNTATQLRALADYYNVGLWGAAQGNRASLSATTVDLDMIAEDIGMTREADIVLSLNQTKEEYADNLARIFAAKVRGGSKNWQVACKVDEGSHAILPYEFQDSSQVFSGDSDKEAESKGRESAIEFRERLSKRRGGRNHE